MPSPIPKTRRFIVPIALLLIAALAGPTGCSGCGDRNEAPADTGADADVALLDGGDTTTADTTADTAMDTVEDTGGSDAGDATDTGALDTDTTSDASDTTSDATDGTSDGGDTNDASDASGDTTADANETGTDTGAADTGTADTGPTPPQGLSTPCSNGSGWTLFKFHWSHNGGSSPRVDVWDASCNYTFAPNSACNVRNIRSPGFNSSRRQPKAILLTSREYIRVRFDVSTLNFSSADLYVQARSYSTSSSTKFNAWSPIYGGKDSPLVDNDWTYDWYHVPWTGYLKPSDDPDLTAIEISGTNGTVAVHAVELCVQ